MRKSDLARFFEILFDGTISDQEYDKLKYEILIRTKQQLRKVIPERYDKAGELLEQEAADFASDVICKLCRARGKPHLEGQSEADWAASILTRLIENLVRDYKATLNPERKHVYDNVHEVLENGETNGIYRRISHFPEESGSSDLFILAAGKNMPVARVDEVLEEDLLQHLDSWLQKTGLGVARLSVKNAGEAVSAALAFPTQQGHLALSASQITNLLCKIRGIDSVVETRIRQMSDTDEGTSEHSTGVDELDELPPDKIVRDVPTSSVEQDMDTRQFVEGIFEPLALTGPHRISDMDIRILAAFYDESTGGLKIRIEETSKKLGLIPYSEVAKNLGIANSRISYAFRNIKNTLEIIQQEQQKFGDSDIQNDLDAYTFITILCQKCHEHINRV